MHRKKKNKSVLRHNQPFERLTPQNYRLKKKKQEPLKESSIPKPAPWTQKTFPSEPSQAKAGLQPLYGV
jgi:hypothetical protein